MAKIDIIEVLKEKGLKVTPQRLAVLESLMNSDKHPSAEDIISSVTSANPGIAIGTIYKILEVFVEKNIIRRIDSERGIMRYDACHAQHHHLHSVESDKIEDYYDEDLNKILDEYFSKKDIPGFEIRDIQLQIKGKFINNN